MTRRGRPTRATSPVTIMLSMALLAEIRTNNPQMLKPLTTEFKYGALSKYIENILWKHIRGPKYHVQSETLSPSLAGPGPGAELDPGRGFPGQTVHTIGAQPGGNLAASRELGSAEPGDEQADIEYPWERPE